MHIRSTLGCAAVAFMVAAAGAAHATTVTVDCGTQNLQTALNANTAAGTVFSISGTCTGGPFSVTHVNDTLEAANVSAVINDQINVFTTNLTVTGFTLNGSGATSGATVGVAVVGFASVLIQGCDIKNWVDGVQADPFANVSIIGGKVELNSGAGVLVSVDGSASIGYDPANTALNAPVEITANGTGVSITSGGALLLSGFVHANTGAGISLDRGAVIIVGTDIDANGGDGIDAMNGASIVFNANRFTLGGPPGEVSNNTGDGIHLNDGALHIDTAQITSNGGNGIKAGEGARIAIETGGNITGNAEAGIHADEATITTNNTTISGNTGGPAILALNSKFESQGDTMSAPATLGQPAILAYRTGGIINGTSVTGPTDSPTLGVFGGASILMYQTTLSDADGTATDATLVIADGSSVVSGGGNIIRNTAGGGFAIIVANGSTFNEERNAVIQKFFTSAADTITGGATVQMQSNMELGTGPTTPSNWTGSIQVSQNSSLRMHGGMTISGGVLLGQGSNGFFNKTAGGNNTVNGTHVTCTGSGSSHVFGDAAVTPAVTPVTTGVGCYNF